MKPRVARIETLRGVAIFLLVWFHVIGADPTMGAHVPAHSPWRHFSASLSYLRMPLFTAISGWVYGMRPIAPGHFVSFLRGKARRLFLPLLTVGALHWLLHPYYPLDGQPQPVDQIWRLLVYQYIHLWYLQALALVFLTVSLVELAKGMATLPRWAMALGAAFAFSYWGPTEEAFFALKGFAYLLPYFCLGLGLCRFQERLRHPWFAAVCAVVAVALQMRFELGPVRWPWPLDVSRRAVFGMVLSASWVALAVLYFPAVTSLQRLGHYAFPIYLIHPLFYAGALHLARALGITSLGIQVSVGTIAGLVGPIAVYEGMAKGGLLRLLFFGERAGQGASQLSPRAGGAL